MTDTLPQPGGYRTTQQICDAQVKLGMTVDHILRLIEAAQDKINTVKHEVANRWKQVADLQPVDRRRLTDRETSNRVREVLDEVVVKIDREYQTAKELNEEIEDAKIYYPGKLQFLMTATFMSEKRAQYATALSLAGPMELAGYASYD